MRSGSVQADVAARPREAVTDLAWIILVWLAAVAIVNPIGNFPLNDDWSYATSVQRMVAGEGFRPTGWTAMTLIAQTTWGAIWAWAFGYSFTILRVSTLALSLAGIAATYGLMRELRQPRWVTVLGTAAVAFNPIGFAMSHTFMTDVPFAALVTISACFYVRHLRRGTALTAVLGTVFAVAAILTRQLGLALPLGFAAAMVFAGLTRRRVLTAAGSLIACVGVFLAFRAWMVATGRDPALAGAKSDALGRVLVDPSTLVTRTLHNGFTTATYLGLFLLPLTIPIVIRLWRGQRGRLVGPLVFASGLVVAGPLLFGGRVVMPSSAGILVRSGLGALTLADPAELRVVNMPGLPHGFWLVATAAAVLGAVLLLVLVSMACLALVRARVQTSTDSAAAVFLFATAGGCLIPVLPIPFFDRYLVPVLPLLAAGIAIVLADHVSTVSWKLRAAAGAVLVALAAFAVLGTKDYLSWNRARWEAAEYLTTTLRVSPHDIDGGFAFNGWYLYDPSYSARPGHNRWWVDRDTYRVTFGPVPGYETIRTFPYRRLLPPGTGAIRVLKRLAEPPVSPGAEARAPTGR